MDRLIELLADRGFDSFREARHRLDLTQRQANGRFTAVEADELIERLEAGVQVEQSRFGDPSAGPGVTDAFLERAAQVRRQEYARTMLDIPDDALADELVRRGWCCIPPPTE